MQTDRLYYHDPYLVHFNARVTEISQDGRRLYLDRTAFYPTSGGQPHDTGSIHGAPVINVIDEEHRIAHEVEQPIEEIQIGSQIHAEIDWARRYGHMQQHTGQHLLSAVFVELLGYETLSFHLGATVSTIELSTPKLSENELEQVERRTNALIREARPVLISFEDSAEANDLRKASERTGTLRIIAIDGIDRSACGGTHVRSTAEIGPVLIRRQEKVRNSTRIEFVCGVRAERRARLDFRLLSELSKVTSVAMDDLPSAVASQRDRLIESEKTRQRLLLEQARVAGEMLHEQTAPDGSGCRRVLLQVAAIDEETRAKVQAFVAKGSAVALVMATAPPSVLFAVSADRDLNAGALLKEALQRHGGRGGGSATSAQGSVPEETALADIAKELGFA